MQFGRIPENVGKFRFYQVERCFDSLNKETCEEFRGGKITELELQNCPDEQIQKYAEYWAPKIENDLETTRKVIEDAVQCIDVEKPKIASEMYHAEYQNIQIIFENCLQKNDNSQCVTEEEAIAYIQQSSNYIFMDF